MRPRVRSLLVLAVAVAAALPSISVAAVGGAGSAVSSTTASTFAVIGDIPYGATQFVDFPGVVDQINADPDVEWVGHLGDIKSGSSVCSDEYFDAIRAQFDRFVDPLVYTPGDNEWTDCHRTNNGAYDPYERLAEIRDTFFPVRNRTLGQNPMVVASQVAKGFIENVRFRSGGAAVAAAHVVGSNNGLAPWTGLTAPTRAQRAEVVRRTSAAVQLIERTFADATAKRRPLVVLMLQADMFDPTIPNPDVADYSAFRRIVTAIATESARFRGDVLLLDGDSHVFVDDQPLAAGSPWLAFYKVRRPVANLTRITVEGSTGVDEWLKVTVDRTTERGFTYERVPLAPTPATNVTINEVESQGGVPGDWVELANRSGVDLDVSGYVIKDDDDTHVGTLPAGSIVPADGYLVVEEATLGFGLGGADQVRFFAPDATTLLASTAWPAHAASTWARCPDATGAFQVASSSTKGAVNDCAALIGINEVESSGGVPGDWVELYNPGPSLSDISGWVFRDNDDTHLYTVPAGTVVAPGAYHVIEEAALGFGLGSADSARLFRADGSLADSYSWTAHAAVTYGRCPNWIGSFADTFGSTKGAANSCEAPVTTVTLNEVESSGGVPGDWAELVNTGATPVDLSGWTFVDNDVTHVPYVIPVGTTIAAGGFLLVEEAQFGFGLGAADSAILARADGSVADSYTWTAHAATTYGRCPDGTGEFATTDAPTKGAANDCPLPSVVLNEVESNGGTPDDWVELMNIGTTSVDLTGWTLLDNDITHVAYAVPAGTTIDPGGLLVLEGFGFGLGSADSVLIADASGSQVISYSWTAHALATYGRCPDGTGGFIDTLASTKGTPNTCGSPIVINEIESTGGVPGDFVELYNPTGGSIDVSGFSLSDNDDTHIFTLPSGTLVPGNGYLVVEESALGFGLGSGDSARLFDTTGIPVDSYTWTAHAASTYGRCPDGTGTFEDTVEPTKGSQNHCSGIPFFGPWPGGASVTTVDDAATFTGNMSGLDYESSGTATPGVLWAVRNGPGALFRLEWNGTTWLPDTDDGWSTGKLLRYPDGTGDVDSEGVTLADSLGQIYVGSERNNAANAISRNSVTLFDTSGSAAELTALREWDLTVDLPATSPNTGIEAITWVPDTFLVAGGFVDQTTGAAYDPATYPGHGSGLFLVGVEATGGVYAYELDHVDGTFTRIATIATGFAGVMGLEFDGEQGDLWAVCDDTCQGRSSILRIVGGSFIVARSIERPAAMPNINNEGFAITPLVECSAGVRPVFWADDSDTGGTSLRAGTLTCTP